MKRFSLLKPILVALVMSMGGLANAAEAVSCHPGPMANAMTGERSDITLSLFGRTFRVRGKCVPTACLPGFFLEDKACKSHMTVAPLKQFMTVAKVDQMVEVKFRLDRVTKEEVNVQVQEVATESTDRALPGIDFELPQQTISIPPGSSVGSLQVMIKKDQVDRPYIQTRKLHLKIVSVGPYGRVKVSETRDTMVISIFDKNPPVAATPVPTPAPVATPVPTPAPTPVPTPVVSEPIKIYKSVVAMSGDKGPLLETDNEGESFHDAAVDDELAGGISRYNYVSFFKDGAFSMIETANGALWISRNNGTEYSVTDLNSQGFYGYSTNLSLVRSGRGSIGVMRNDYEYNMLNYVLSTDGGQTWSEVNLPAFGNIDQILVSGNNILEAFTDGGGQRVWMISRNAGAGPWEDITPNMGPDLRASLNIMAMDENTIVTQFINDNTGEEYLKISRDGGYTWEDLSLPIRPQGIRIDRDAILIWGSENFAPATDFYLSKDRGNSFQKIYTLPAGVPELVEIDAP